MHRSILFRLIFFAAFTAGTPFIPAAETPPPLISAGISGDSLPSDGVPLTVENAPNAETASLQIKTLKNPKAIEVTAEKLKIHDGFAAQFWVTEDESLFLNVAKTGLISVVPVSVVHRSASLFIALFIMDPGVARSTLKKDKRKKYSDVTYDYEIMEARGARSVERKTMIAWNTRPPLAHLVQLAYGHSGEIPESAANFSTSTLTSIAEKPDKAQFEFQIIHPAGEYLVKVRVHDNVKKVTIELERKIVLEE